MHVVFLPCKLGLGKVHKDSAFTLCYTNELVLLEGWFKYVLPISKMFCFLLITSHSAISCSLLQTLKLLLLYLGKVHHVCIARPHFDQECITVLWLKPDIYPPFSFLVCRLELVKGQLISKCLFGVFNSPKKQTKRLWLVQVTLIVDTVVT